MAARSLEARDLAKISGVHRDSIARARQGQPVTRATLQKLAAGLVKVPINPLMGRLVGVGKAKSS
jgi:transcriptional regulator with XRE-family HTH domain